MGGVIRFLVYLNWSVAFEDLDRRREYPSSWMWQAVCVVLGFDRVERAFGYFELAAGGEEQVAPLLGFGLHAWEQCGCCRLGVGVKVVHSLCAIIYESYHSDGQGLCVVVGGERGSLS